MAPPTVSRCLFCGTTAGKRTREHIWRNSLRSRFQKVESLTFWNRVGLDTDELVHTRPISQFDMTVNAVCSDCNSGWLNALEDLALPSLVFFALGSGPVPTRTQLDDFAFWAVTRSLLRTHYSPAGRAPESLFRTVYDQRESRVIPTGCIVSIAPTQPVSMEAGTHQSVRLDGHNFLGHVAVSWGTLLISVLLASPDPLTIGLAAQACSQQRQWFPRAFWQLAPFVPPSSPGYVLEPADTVLAGALLGFLLDLRPAEQFGNPLDLGSRVPPERRGEVPWRAGWSN